MWTDAVIGYLIAATIFFLAFFIATGGFEDDIR